MEVCPGTSPFRPLYSHEKAISENVFIGSNCPGGNVPVDLQSPSSEAPAIGPGLL